MNLPSRMHRELRVARAMAVLRAGRVSFGKRPLIYRQSPIIHNQGRITVGERVDLVCDEFRLVLRADAGGELRIGDRVLINSGAHIHARESVTIGDDCKIASLVSITDTDSHEVEPGAPVRVQPVSIDRNVWIGRAAIILPGVSIGEGSVIGAGSVVTKDVPAFTVVAGNPARVIRLFTPTETARK